MFFEPEEAVFNENYSEKTNKGHGRIETRRCWVCTNIEALGIDTSDGEKLRAITVFNYLNVYKLGFLDNLECHLNGFTGRSAANIGR